MYLSTCFLNSRMPVGSASRRSLPVGLVALGCLGAVAAQGAVLDFEGLADATSVGGTYAAQGVSFSNARVLTAGLSLNEFDFPPTSGSNAVFDDGGPVSGTFSTPVSSLSGYFTYSARVTLRAFDTSNVELLSVSSAFTENYVSSGTGSPNELLSLSFPGGISSFRIEGERAGSSFVMDDFAFTPVPEASSAAVVGAALGAFAWFRRSRRGSRNA